MFATNCLQNEKSGREHEIPARSFYAVCGHDLRGAFLTVHKARRGVPVKNAFRQLPKASDSFSEGGRQRAEVGRIADRYGTQGVPFGD